MREKEKEEKKKGAFSKNRSTKTVFNLEMTLIRYFIKI